MVIKRLQYLLFRGFANRFNVLFNFHFKCTRQSQLKSSYGAWTTEQAYAPIERQLQSLVENVVRTNVQAVSFPGTKRPHFRSLCGRFITGNENVWERNVLVPIAQAQCPLNYRQAQIYSRTRRHPMMSLDNSVTYCLCRCVKCYNQLYFLVVNHLLFYGIVFVFVNFVLPVFQTLLADIFTMVLNRVV